MEKKYSYSLNLLSEKDSLDKLNKYYEKQKEKLNQEKQNLNETIYNQRKEIEELKDNIEVLNMKLEEKTNEYENKCSQWSNNLQTINFLQNNIKEQDKKIEKLNYINYQDSVKIQTYKNERENLINILRCISKKKSKESISIYIANLSEKIKKQIEEILK
jgi:chromosome segregation ATPase